MNKLLARCPVCAGPLHVTELACEACDAQVRSHFEACRFCSLTQEQLQFVEIFLRHRGNITSVGETLGISHPTVTRRLEAAIAALSGVPPHINQVSTPPAPISAPDTPFVPEPDMRDFERTTILEMLDRGEISAEDATRRLSEL